MKRLFSKASVVVTVCSGHVKVMTFEADSFNEAQAKADQVLGVLARMGINQLEIGLVQDAWFEELPAGAHINRVVVLTRTNLLLRPDRLRREYVCSHQLAQLA